jgi:hypothetical protein
MNIKNNCLIIIIGEAFREGLNSSRLRDTNYGYNNQLECINLGLANKLKYVGLIEGEKCMGTNKIKEESFVTKYNCDYPCNEANTGYCGGFYYNQVYKIDENIINNLNDNNKESPINNKKIESFKNIPVTSKLRSINGIEFIIWIININIINIKKSI